ncbi:hypothetical protein ID866_1757 [Astraeus odoratus]|nr:hypothetical protein ID866_1757 [Astraeus odoratus]
MSSPGSPLLPRDVSSSTSIFFWRSGALLVVTGLIAGAFGAHALKRRPGITADNLYAWGTASNYAISNGLGLLLLSLHPRFSSHRFAGYSILGGCTIFSGSIMALILSKNLKFLGPITPLGGMLMIAGYLSLAF